MASPSTATTSVSPTSRAGSVTGLPSTVTRPARTICSEARREAIPAAARYLASRIGRTHPTLTVMDLQLLGQTLDQLDEPAFRARQVWRWIAQGANSYESMTDLPRGLRSVLEERVPFSKLAPVDQAQPRDGTVKALFQTADG